MKAIRVPRPGGPDVLETEEIPLAEPSPGWVRIRVLAFGLNRSETYTRQSHSRGVQFLHVLENECVRIVDHSGGAGLEAGQAVAALMVETGRAYNGGHAQCTLVPHDRVLPVRRALPWDLLASLPETYLTAWGSLVAAMAVEAVQTHLFRGGTSSVSGRPSDQSEAVAQGPPEALVQEVVQVCAEAACAAHSEKRRRSRGMAGDRRTLALPEHTKGLAQRASKAAA